MSTMPPCTDDDGSWSLDRKRRNIIERCFNRLKQFRYLATRYAKRAAYYHAELTIATIILWL
jgi:transposase